VRSDPDVAPGWHRLLHLKAFTVGACSANKAQTCNSKINRITVGENFDLDHAVMKAFVEEQVDVHRDALAKKLVEEARQRERIEKKRLEEERKRERESKGRRLVHGNESSDHRKLYVNKHGVFDLDGMISETSADNFPNFMKVTDRKWGLTRSEMALRFDLLRQRFKPTFITTIINSEINMVQPSDFRTGLQALYATRCSDMLKRTFPERDDLQCCRVAPVGTYCRPEITYGVNQDCSDSPLELASTNDGTLDEEFMTRLLGASPPPSPPPSPSPPPPPSPPNPPPPPSPPVAISASQGKSIALLAQRHFCDSVYIMSAESRCSTLATAMAASFVLGDGFSPPALSPLSKPRPSPPPPPPSPPRPRLPMNESVRIVYQRPLSATLSTYFLGSAETDPGTASSLLGNDMELTNVRNVTRTIVVDAITETKALEEWAACSTDMVERGSPLPCRTGDLPERCINGAERCGTAFENSHEPWVEFNLHAGLPTDGRDYYFFALEIQLPTNPTYGALFFASSNGVSLDRGDVTNRYYRVEVYDTNHNPLPVQCKPYFKQSTDFYVNGMVHFQYVCLETLAEDLAYVTMRRVRYVRLTLLGDYRMIWIQGVRVMWRTLDSLPPANPPQPPLPPVPPLPGAPPDAPYVTRECHTYPDKSFGNTFPVAFQEPCGLTQEQCCSLSYEHKNTAAWELSPSGCCTLLNVEEDNIYGLTTKEIKPLMQDSVVTGVAISGARNSVV
tara:strand:- start:129 stop:2324 length:2196 start_codon:yes stop_codon:yes gene_type:complete